VASLKTSVEQAALVAESADLQLKVLDEQVATQFDGLPNLLDDAVPFGKGDEDNQVVLEWGTHLRKVLADQDQDPASTSSEYQWHDDLAASLGGYLPEEAVNLAGKKR
jgi:seryl-tRNA synthetase